MMPSRGAQLGLRALRASQRHIHPGSRNFTTGPSRPVVLSIAQQQTAFRYSQEQRRNFSWNPLDWTKSPAQPAAVTNPTPPLAPTPSAAIKETATSGQHAQTTAPATPAVESTVVSSAPVEVNLDNVASFEPATQEHIGYLHSLGLDYGYGPTSMVQWLLEHVHIWTGTPWWASLIITAITIRAAFIPLTIKMSDSQARMAHIKPVLDPLNKRLAETLRNKDQLAMAETRKEINAIRKRSGFSFKWMGITMTGNMVFAYCSFKLLRAMAALPVPGFIDGGALWFQNLTLADPYYLIPGLMAAGFHLSIRYSAETGGVDPYAGQPGMRSLMLYVFPVIIWVSMAWFSAALTLWMAAGGLVSMLVGRSLLNPNVRERLGITPMPKRAAEPMPTIANFFREETAESATAAAAAPGRVVDVKGTRSTPGQMTYQAPRLNRSKFSTASTSSYSNPSTIVPPTTQETVKAAAPEQPQKGSVERYTEWASARVNDLGEGYALIGRKAKNMFSQAKRMRDDDVPESKTKSKDYLRQAKEYERRYEQEKRRGWR